MSLFYVLDLIGTFVFGLSGAVMAVRHKFDILGVFILAVITGTGGGIFRDIVLGETPPSSFVNTEYIGVCVLAGICTFMSPERVCSRKDLLTVLDAIGLGVFVYIGASKAIALDLNFFSVVFCGVVTGVGGGVLRDVLVNEVSGILKSEFYATSAIIGSTYLFVFHSLLPTGVMIASTIVLTTTVRLITWRNQVGLPMSEEGKNYVGS